MKKILMIMVMGAALFPAFAQKMDASKVPVDVKKSFEKKYPGAIARWEKEDGKYEVNFKQNNHSMSVLIEPNGTIVETEMDIKINDLPATAASYIKEHYKGKTIKEASKITKADGTVSYEAEVASADVIFDSDGKFLKEIREEKKEKD